LCLTLEFFESARLLTLSGICKTFSGTRTVLRDVNLSVASGEYIAIMGESGSGKSTLLNLIAGLDTPDSGSVIADGQELGSLDDAALTRLRRAKMGFVFQAFHVLPHLTVAQNVALPLSLNGVDRHQAARRTSAMLAAVGLAGRDHSMPRELSGGELQRVAIARALVHQPRLLLADEPTGNLDSETAAQIMKLLRDELKANEAAGILVTHSAAAAATADKTYLLSASGLRLNAGTVHSSAPASSLSDAAVKSEWKQETPRHP
jgi:putative ABC transport system ATP-binding protein